MQKPAISREGSLPSYIYSTSIYIILNVSEPVTYKLCVMVHSCLQGQAQQYLVDLCLPVSDVAFRQYLRSASLDSRYFRVTSCKRTADGLFLWLACRPGTCAWQFERSECHQRQLPQTFENTFVRSVVCTEASSALEVLRKCAVQTNTYLLTSSKKSNVLLALLVTVKSN